MTLALLLWLEAFRLFGAGFFYFAHAALTALGALSPLEASLALAFRLLAEPLFALYGGHLADRWPRGRLLLLAALGQGGLTLALLPLLSAPSPLPLYLLGFLFAFLEALRMVAAGAPLADLLPKEALARARGQLGALYAAADALSDLAAGLLFLFTRSRPWTVGRGSAGPGEGLLSPGPPGRSPEPRGGLGRAPGRGGPGAVRRRRYPEARPGPRGARPPGDRPASPLAPPRGFDLSPGGWGRPLRRGGRGGAPEPGPPGASGPGGGRLSLPERSPGPLRPPLGRALAGVALPLPFLLAGGLLLALAPLVRWRGRA
ncbi:MFS transporter [Thermus thermophilus]|uniref:MFS transporter n=1 Tax=Thermus thermophilus TaxID=274 RepID=UPI001CC584C4|nr:MFS transporter [Thermus thermophilus]BDB12148.1 hypothetical protein TthTMY_18870 [Thermus thermophilus]